MTPAAVAEPVVVPPQIADVPAQIDTVARDLTDVATRLRTQLVSYASAAARARSAPGASEAAGTAELERTRLDRIGSQVADIRSRLDALAGTLADAAASGVVVDAQIKSAGSLIGRTRALTVDYDRAIADSGVPASARRSD